MEGKYSVMQEVIHIPAFPGVVSGSEELERLAGGWLCPSVSMLRLPRGLPQQREFLMEASLLQQWELWGGHRGYGHALLWVLGLDNLQLEPPRVLFGREPRANQPFQMHPAAWLALACTGLLQALSCSFCAVISFNKESPRWLRRLK